MAVTNQVTVRFNEKVLAAVKADAKKISAGGPKTGYQTRINQVLAQHYRIALPAHHFSRGPKPSVALAAPTKAKVKKKVEALPLAAAPKKKAATKKSLKAKSKGAKKKAR